VTALLAICVFLVDLTSPASVGVSMNKDERMVYREILSCVRSEDLGLPFPEDFDVLINKVSFVGPLDTLVTIRQPPREFDEAMEAFRHGWRGDTDMSPLAGDGVEIIDIIRQRRFGCKVLLSHVGFDAQKKRAVSVVWFFWQKKNGIYYDLKALVYLVRVGRKWAMSGYRPLDVKRGWDEYVGP
jgi:hypothetical protein